ncbi:hypothetical protein KP001_13045 [Geomonas subterranea]|uniref:Uncharacterized protein n=1 Tax=Geomonas subterranea TaxID=2847989 RepID=A0ABX8LFE3_9BACT|nr:hypothetical protein [Geomonas subterranea]QXE89380.1 hypothetical protein KP001_13045 [Geomonas subterranea]QXM08504.1 hypothetical protein KP002_16225 [Geomonas subterranea]
MKQQIMAAPTALNAGKILAPAPLLIAALPHLPARGRADSPSRVPARHPRRLWGREDGFTMAAPR